MLKNLSIGLLAVSTLALPATSFAKGLDLHSKVNLAAGVKTEERHDNGLHRGQEKRHQDFQVSMTGVLTTMSGNTLTIKSASTTTYTIDATNAKLSRRFGGAMSLTDLQVNDQLFVKGKLTGTTITASAIEDLSLQARNGEFSGTVQSLTGSSFVLQSANRGLQTINTNASTTVMKNGQKGTLADVVVGSTLKVDGVWDRTNSNVTARKITVVVKNVAERVNGSVTAVNGTSITVLGTDGKSYVVDATKVKISGFNYFGTDATKVHVGDHVQVWGKGMTDSLNLNASLLIDFSLV